MPPRNCPRTRCAPSCRRTRNTRRAAKHAHAVWHGICAAILARTEWGVTDEAVLSAIACHTAGKAGMTQLDKILYLADMTSAERDWPGVEKLRKLEMKDLDAAMLAALRQTNGFVLSEGKPLDPESKAAYEDILAHSGQNEG